MPKDGIRLDVYVSNENDISRSSAQKLIEDGNVTVNGKLQNKNYKVDDDDDVIIVQPELKSCEVLPEDIPLEIVYEDDSLIVVNKPKGMVVHPAPGNYSRTLVNALLYHCKDSLSGINGVIRPGIVHRIDKNTSGLLVVAKCDSAHNFLAEQIKVHSFERIYTAIIVGHLKVNELTIDAPIGRNLKDRKKMAIVSDGRRAVTHVKVLREFSGYSLIQCKLETGRTHQIRVHLQSLGHPLLGDDVYGNPNDLFCKKHPDIIIGQCLHAGTLGFIHPETKEIVSFTVEPPEIFNKTLAILESNNNG